MTQSRPKPRPKLRTERVSRPSFPSVATDQAIRGLKRGRRWQVICGDRGHYRIGLYSPEIASVSEIREFEKHDCDEFFILLEGKMSLVLMREVGGKQVIRTVRLKPLQPILVRTWHAGICPDGPFTGSAIVVERDAFKSWYLSSQQRRAKSSRSALRHRQ